MAPSQKAFKQSGIFAKKTAQSQRAENINPADATEGNFVSERGDSALNRISTGRGKGPCLTDAARYATIPGVPSVGLPLRQDPNVSLSAERRN
jgi:hypothetical protein